MGTITARTVFNTAEWCCWLAGCLAGWLAGGLAGWLVDWLAGSIWLARGHFGSSLSRSRAFFPFLPSSVFLAQRAMVVVSSTTTPLATSPSRPRGGRPAALRALASSLGRALRHSGRVLTPLDMARFAAPLKEVLADLNGTLNAYCASGKVAAAPPSLEKGLPLLTALRLGRALGCSRRGPQRITQLGNPLWRPIPS